MADWYCSSAAYASVSAFVASAAYTVGQFVKPTAPAVTTSWVFRCTTAGTASTEPTWPTANNSTVTTGGATFTNVTGQSTYGWSAAAGAYATISNQGRSLAGDRVFLSSDHSDTSGPTAWASNNSVAAFGVIQMISVNRSGSVPPVDADILSGAAIATSSGNLQLDAYCNLFWQGITFTSASSVQLNQAGSALKGHYFKNCAFKFSTTGTLRAGISTRVVFDNTTLQCASTGNNISANSAPFEFTWINTAGAIVGATIPVALFIGSGSSLNVTCRGVDLSAITGTLLNVSTVASEMSKVLLDSCKIASASTRFNTATGSPSHDEIELVNCYDGTNVINERHTAAGDVTTDRSTYLTGGAQDDIGNYALKLASSSRSDKFTFPLDSFWLDVENTVIGASHTATVEIISSASLNTDDISLLLEYMGTSGSSVVSFVSSLPATVLTAGTALTSSSSTWNSPPSTPQKQLLQVTFTPQVAGRVRGLVKLGKPSTTCWVDPRITVT